MSTSQPVGGSLDLVRQRDIEDVAVVDLGHLDDLVDAYVEAATPASTKAAYTRDVTHYAEWCELAGIDPLEHRSVARYLARLGDTGFKITTIERRLSAICIAFKELEEPSPRHNMRVVRALRGIRRTHPYVRRRARALTNAELLQILEHLPNTLQGHRDRVALLLGQQGALRRAELVAIDVDHQTRVPEGLVLRIPTSKTDPNFDGVEIGIPAGIRPTTCPAAAVDRWLSVTGITTGPLLRAVDRWGNVSDQRMTPRSIGILLTRAARQAGVSTEGLSAHSLRAGFATAVATTASERAIAAHGRWRNMAVLRGYIRHASLFEEHPVQPLGHADLPEV